MINCSFCSEFTDALPEKSLFEAIKNEDFPNRIIWQNEYFILIPTIGCFLEGYVLLITKRHVPTFGALNQEEFRSLRQIFPNIVKAIRKEYGGAIVFEHGSVGQCATGGGACQDHAHIHLIPKNIEFKSDIDHLFDIQRLVDIEKLESYETTGTPYLMFSTPDDSFYVCDAYNIQSQFLRILTCSKEGIAEYWNWKTHPFPENMLLTYKKLRQNTLLNTLK